MIYLRQSLKMAAYETARLAIVPGVKRSDLDVCCDVFLRSRKLNGYTLEVSDVFENASYKDPITVTIEIPAERCALVGTWFYKKQVFRESVTIMSEFDGDEE